jgi:hypothetical protein
MQVKPPDLSAKADGNSQVAIKKFLLILHAQSYGRLSEWLGIGLQNRERRFESATDLNKIP